MAPIEEEERRAAYHQAGHAVVAYRLLGRDVRLEKNLSLERDAKGDLALSLRYSDPTPEETKMVIALAGFLAEAEVPGLGGWKAEWNQTKRFPPSPIRRELQSHGASRLMEVADESRASSMDLITNQDKARKLVRDNWPAIQEVADKLLSQESVSDRELLEIMQL